jgi:hypothetical protein
MIVEPIERPIEEMPDYDPIGVESSPDVSAESFRAWEAEMQAHAPPGVALALAPALESLPRWFEPAKDTMRFAMETIRSMPRTELDPQHTRPPNWDIYWASNPHVQLEIVKRYYARMTRATDGRSKVMHRVMRRQIDIIRAQTSQRFATVARSLSTISGDLRRGLRLRDANLAATVKVVNAHIANVTKATKLDLQRWTVSQVAAPIYHKIDANMAQTVRLVGRAETVAHDDARQQIGVAVAPLLATVLAIQTQVGALQQESDECTKPMCATMGPKTDLGRLLAGLKVAKWLAILAALETIDVKDLERLAATVAGTEAAIGTWVGERILGELEAEH